MTAKLRTALTGFLIAVISPALAQAPLQISPPAQSGARTAPAAKTQKSKPKATRVQAPRAQAPSPQASHAQAPKPAAKPAKAVAKKPAATPAPAVPAPAVPAPAVPAPAVPAQVVPAPVPTDDQVWPAPPAASAFAAPIAPAPTDSALTTAFTAYQRGYYMTAFTDATRLAGEKADPKAMALLGEIYANRNTGL